MLDGTASQVEWNLAKIGSANWELEERRKASASSFCATLMLMVPKLGRWDAAGPLRVRLCLYVYGFPVSHSVSQDRLGRGLEYMGGCLG